MMDVNSTSEVPFHIMEDIKHLENHYMIWILGHLLMPTELGKTKNILTHLMKLGKHVLYSAIMNISAIHIPYT